ncbi:molybdenum cofactor biosynthesis protein MoaE [Halorhodospira abdelmalekii]|uniref:molybdenum cofactor biosynthesis protein MoaE n=1 Tax=Halorhodospira abdelmalekii TaxID=421629 RepID=UPI001905E767|nr:molybdenum cofactor biosynthesis protein MoaE [Halorhodospira abdelmalekii]
MINGNVEENAVTADPIYTAIQSDPLDPAAAFAFVHTPHHGAVNLFTGTVRDHHAGESVSALHYDVHLLLAEQTFRSIAAEAVEQWPGLRIYIVHASGERLPGEISVIVAVSAAHRQESFAGCRYLIDQLKQRAPIWKEERYSDGRREWLPGHSLLAAERQVDPE